ncbi:hypothetical protein D3C71_1477480 [compost metagenome]
MEIDEDNIDDAVLALLWLTLHNQRCAWKAITTDQFVREVDAYIRWYNEKRIKISLGSLSPIEYRRSLGLDP